MESPPELNLIIFESISLPRSVLEDDAIDDFIPEPNIMLDDMGSSNYVQDAFSFRGTAAAADPLFEAWDWTPSTVSSSSSSSQPLLDFSPEPNSMPTLLLNEPQELCSSIIDNGTLWEPCKEVSSSRSPQRSRKSRHRGNVPQLGEAGRAQLKSAISASIRGNTRRKAICREIGVLKSATIRELIQMANAIGLGYVVDELVTDFERLKEQKRILRPLKQATRKRVTKRNQDV
ncbi:hypothetical protein FOL47_002639 [Perkinsus chesapeaki]|uniref:Uncharacterized protein n=1 Tax=Perkinsus chesapeaki TaxID=330153 RepID=A0A7J6MDN1_PERCH|nr:hypothetical protein FOL47_002639 [Perkinsus chesapeaki]